MNNRKKNIQLPTIANRSVAGNVQAKSSSGNAPARSSSGNVPTQSPSPNIIQRKIAATNFKDLVAEQMALSQMISIEKDLPAEERRLNKHTTVGFEFEFAAMKGRNPFIGASHVEISESQQEINGLPFKLETDASNTLELVTPPLWIETIPELPIPLPEEIKRVDELAKNRLKTITGDLDATRSTSSAEASAAEEDNDKQAEIITMKKMVADLSADPGLDFALEEVEVEAKNLSRNILADYSKAKNKVSKDEIEKIEIAKVTKWKKGIDTQINMATNAETFVALEQIMQSLKPWSQSDRYEHLYSYLMTAALPLLSNFAKEISPGLASFAKIVIRYFSGLPAIPYAAWLREQLDFLYNAADKARSDRMRSIIGLPAEKDAVSGRPFAPWAPEDNTGAVASFYSTAASTTSHVKDVHEVWLKDTLMNAGLGLLKKEDWAIVYAWMQAFTDKNIPAGYSPPEKLLQRIVQGASGEETRVPLNRNELDRMTALYVALRNSLIAAAQQIQKDITAYKLAETDTENAFLGPLHQQEFLKHDPRWIGARQDTYIDGPLVSLPALWPGLRLHVVELRMEDIVGALDALTKAAPKVAGKKDLTLPPVRLINLQDWINETGFMTAPCINSFFNDYARSVDDPMAGRYDLTKECRFPAAAPVNFIRWLHKNKLTLSDWSEESNLPLYFLGFVKDRYLPTYKIEELTFYTTHKANFRRLIFEFDLHLQKNPDEAGKVWEEMVLCATQKSISLDTIKKENVLAWREEKRVAANQLAARNNPWNKGK